MPLLEALVVYHALAEGPAYARVRAIKRYSTTDRQALPEATEACADGLTFSNDRSPVCAPRRTPWMPLFK